MVPRSFVFELGHLTRASEFRGALETLVVSLVVRSLFRMVLKYNCCIGRWDLIRQRIKLKT